MAGSYTHVTTEDGKLRSNESFVGMIENLGDAYEAVEEMYGMLWFLADALSHEQAVYAPEYWMDLAREQWKLGIDELSPGRQKD